MKAYAILILLTLFASAVAVPVKSDDAKDQEQLRQLVRAWDEAFVKNDPATLDRLLADDFEFVNGLKKREYLASFKERPKGLVESALSGDLTVQIYENAAVVTGVDTIGGKRQGQPYETKWRFMDVWIRRSGRWQCVKSFVNKIVL